MRKRGTYYVRKKFRPARVREDGNCGRKAYEKTQTPQTSPEKEVPIVGKGGKICKKGGLAQKIARGETTKEIDVTRKEKTMTLLSGGPVHG